MTRPNPQARDLKIQTNKPNTTTQMTINRNPNRLLFSEYPYNEPPRKPKAKKEEPKKSKRVKPDKPDDLSKVHRGLPQSAQHALPKDNKREYYSGSIKRGLSFEKFYNE